MFRLLLVASIVACAFGDPSLDWRKKGVVPPVADQQQSGSAVGFAVISDIEAVNAVQSGHLVETNVTRTLECSGCGASSQLSCLLKYVVSKGGLCAASATSCDCTATIPVSAFSDVKSDPDSLMAAVSKRPVVALVEADQPAFMFYNGGILTPSDHCGDKVDHAVLVVGYGTENGVDYFTIQNSWGAAWGEEGAARIQRSSADVCGINSQAFYAQA